MEKIAKKYKVDPSAIYDYELNHLNPGDALTVGQKRGVPGGKNHRSKNCPSVPWPDSGNGGTWHRQLGLTRERRHDPEILVRAFWTLEIGIVKSKTCGASVRET